MSQTASRNPLRHGICYALLLPTFLLISVFNIVPFVTAFVTSFCQYEPGEASVFVGLANYRECLDDPILAPSFGNMLFLTAFAALVQIVFPLVLAKLIHALQSERARYVYRVLFLTPIVVPMVATVMIWQSLVYGNWGLVNELLRLVGLGEHTVGWLSDPKIALWALAFLGFPFANGINILIFYAGLSGISESIHEAAYLDGSHGVRKFFMIDTPLVLSQIKLILTLTIIGGIQGFQHILIFTKGGPGFSTMVPGLWMYYNAFSFQRMGYACAVGVVLFLIILGLTMLNLRYFKSSEAIQGGA